MRDVPAVLHTAVRLFLRHWPALLVLALLGAALRNGVVWAAVRLSEVNGQLGQLLLVLAPLGYLLPVVAMLAICGRSLPAVQAARAEVAVAPTERRRLQLVDVAVSVLVPFLAVYQSYALLEEDLDRFRNSAAAADVIERGVLGPEDLERASRLGIYPVHVALLVVLGCWLLRLALGRLERTFRVRALAYVGALVELFYVVQLASQLVVLQVKGRPWVEDRVAAQWVRDGYDAVADALGPLDDAFRAVVDGVQAVLGSLDAVVVVPVGWLTVAAVVLGYRLLEDRRPAEPEGGGFLRALWVDVRERFSALVDGVRLLAAAGLGPMLVFSLVFLLVTHLPATVHDVFRAVVGPQQFATWVAINPFETAAGFALSMVLTAPLLAAAVDWLIRTRTALRSQASPTTPAPA